MRSFRWITRLRIRQLRKAIPIIEKRIKIALLDGDLVRAGAHRVSLIDAREKIARLLCKLEGRDV